MLSVLDIIAHQVAGPENQLGEGTLGIVIQEGDGLAGAHIDAIPVFHHPGFAGLSPGIVPQVQVDGEQTEPGAQPGAGPEQRRNGRHIPLRRGHIGLILLAEVVHQALFLAPDLPGQEEGLHGKHHQRPEGPEIDQDTGIEDVYAQQHRIPADAVWSVRHQVFGPGRHLIPVGIERIALAHAAHIDDAPDAQRKPQENQNHGHNHLHGRFGQIGEAPSGDHPHQRRNPQHEQEEAQQISENVTHERRLLSVRDPGSRPRRSAGQCSSSANKGWREWPFRHWRK